MLGKSSRYAFATLCALWVSSASAETAFVLGPLDPNKAANSVSVLGQSFEVTHDTVCAVRGAVVSRGACRAELTDYAYVAVEADPVVPSKAAAILVLADRYVPGASLVKVIGRVTSERPAIGLTSINQLAVDHTSLQRNSSLRSSVGALAEIVGTQPLLNGVVLANSRRELIAPTTQIIVGTGRASLADTNIIVGTGKASAIDASTNIIVGTGKAKTPSTNIIVGTGRASASTNIIVGTGRAKLAETNIIVGTGKAQAASTDIIVGTGRASASTNIIVGTGRAKLAETNIIVGTGKAQAVSTDIIVGTGRASASTNIIVGTGKSAAASTNIIVGTGRSALASTDIIVGTGRQ